MTILRRSAPTLTGVARQLAAFERQYSISTADFTADDERSNDVDEDDAMQWMYLLEQLSALQEAAVGRLYSAVSFREPLRNEENSPELLVA